MPKGVGRENLKLRADGRKGGGGAEEGREIGRRSMFLVPYSQYLCVGKKLGTLLCNRSLEILVKFPYAI